MAYLAEVQQAVDRYYRLAGGGSLPALSDFLGVEKHRPKDVQDRIDEREKAREAERKKAEDALSCRSNWDALEGFALWDAMAGEEDDTTKARLEQLADAGKDLIDMIGSYLESQYDTLTADNTPRESGDRSHCHSRREWERKNADIEGPLSLLYPKEMMADLPCADFKQHENQDLAWAVHVSYRIVAELGHWIDEKMTDELLHFYVYYEDPCQSRLTAIEVYMDNLITYWEYRNQELSKDLRTCYEALQNACKKADKRFKHLSILPYWNDKDYNPKEAKSCAVAFRDKLLHIASMAHKELDEAERKLSGPVPSGKTPATDVQRQWEVPWDEDDRNYWPSSEAREKITGGEMKASWFSKHLLRQTEFHFMRRYGETGQPFQTRVHVAEFFRFCQKRSRLPDDEVWKRMIEALRHTNEQQAQELERLKGYRE